ncbi:hypothetical protein C8Q76DRAFT_801818 [Earliella scabrosa]|nr:hypothetical protein C8Q76DRAFT_801818 [Earliella scabrosa]
MDSPVIVSEGDTEIVRQLKVKVLRVHGLEPLELLTQDRVTYVEVKVDGVTKRARIGPGDPADCSDATFELPFLLDANITFRITCRQPPASFYDIIGECQKPITWLDSSNGATELSIALEKSASSSQTTLCIDFLYVAETKRLWLPSRVTPLTLAGPDVLTDISHHLPHSPRWRLVDAQEYVINGIVKVVEVPSLAHQEFVAISYRWTPEITSWRAQIMKYGRHQPDYHGKLEVGSSILSASISNSLINDASVLEGHRFLTQVAFHVMLVQKQYFWIDIVCIDQDKPEEKVFFVPKMGTLYATAAVTHAYPTGTSFLPSLGTPELYFPVWETRAWTLQEHIQSRCVIFLYLFEGHVAQEAVKISSKGSTPIENPKISWEIPCSSGMVHVDGVQTGENVCYLWQSSTEVTTSVIEQESWTGGLPLSAFLNIHCSARSDSASASSQSPSYPWDHGLRRSTIYKDISSLREPSDAASDVGADLTTHHLTENNLQKLRTSLALQGSRHATVLADMVYSLLSVLPMEDFPVSYDLLPEDQQLIITASRDGDEKSVNRARHEGEVRLAEEARLRLFEKMPTHVLSSILGIDWIGVPSPNRDSALPRIYNTHTLIGVALRKVTITNAHFSRAVGTILHARRARLRIWKDIDQTKKDVPMLRAGMGAQPYSHPKLPALRLMVMLAVDLSDHPDSDNIPTSSIPKENVHIVILDGSTVGVSDEQYQDPDFPFDITLEFVEIGPSSHQVILQPVHDMDPNGASWESWNHSTDITRSPALLGLVCVADDSGTLNNRGTALVLKLSGLSTDFMEHVIV